MKPTRSGRTRALTCALVVTMTSSLAAAGPPAEGAVQAEGAVRAEAAVHAGPVAALERQMRGHDGVRVTSVSRAFFQADGFRVTARWREVGEFGGGEVAAKDITYPRGNSAGVKRSIIFTDRSYALHRKRPGYVPEGKPWVLDVRKNDLYLECGKIRLSDPATLRRVLATTTSKRPAGVYDGARTTLHEGSVTVGELYELNPTLWVDVFEKPTGRYASYAELPVRWRLWIGRDQLVRRCQTRYDEPAALGNDRERSFMTDDVRFSGWGDAIDIEPPPGDEVSTRDEFVFSDD
ncbi:hypothetical protein AB0L05_15585 [Nonomuraea pusilla]|uniref:hypothetical protein n=1 Tax=Nonomuraea pusilla TaxID=46177 RepID=UPI0033282E75